MEIKKNFFAPLASGLGATRRAAMLLLVMMLTATTAWAQSGSCGDNLAWRLTAHTLTISGSGAMADYASVAAQPWKDCRSSIKTVVIRNGVTSIGKYAFNGCSSLKSVTFQEGSELTSIGERAFYGTDLKSIEIPASVTSIGGSAFSGSSLGSVTFADGSRLESIGAWAFYNTGLTSIEIPASVTSIGERAFASCSNLEAITVDGGNAVYDSRNGCNAIIEKLSNTLIAGCKNTTIPDGVTSIRNYAFYGCTGLTSIEIPAGVTSIGERAFYTTDLTSIEIPASVTSIGKYAFSECTNLESVTFAEGSQLESIGNYAFQNCSNLTSIIIPASVTSIGSYVFQRLYLETSKQPQTMKSI